MLYDAVKCYVNEQLELELEYATEPTVYDWKSHFEIYRSQV